MTIWVGFLVLVGALLLLDLFVLHRKDEVLSIQKSLWWTLFWIAIAMIFNVAIYFQYEQNWMGWTDSPWHDLTGTEAAIQFFTGYVVEKSLSVDNIFVIAMIFTYFAIPPQNQRRVLFWGIFGAVVLRGIMIALGTVLLKKFEVLEYVFGLVLLFSAGKMLFMHSDNIEPEKSFAVRLVRRFIPVADHFEGHKFFIKLEGKRAATRLFLALVLVETSDVVFAVDSIPAVFAITKDPFIVFTSNIFAILGLRALYFAVAGMLGRFRYLQTALVVLLAFVGTKMLLGYYYHIPNLTSLAIILTILMIGIVASIVTDRGRVG